LKNYGTAQASFVYDLYLKAGSDIAHFEDLQCSIIACEFKACAK